jgi:hypothetical protein
MTLRAEETATLDPVVLCVLASPGAQLAVNWEATAINASGRVSGNLKLRVGGAFRAADMLRGISLDEDYS